ncbi:MAG: class I SAM-dependent methyltransferase [Gammaproteobacteria bacterium]|nr:class I SAM-dependent methyltransferase [Gammaproteobacteria bacterium]
MSAKELQLGFSQAHRGTVFNAKARLQKAKKVIAILEDNLGELSHLDLLEIGSAAGYGSEYFAEHFHYMVAVDVDQPATQHAHHNNPAQNLSYGIMDAQHLAFPDESFDVVICVHVYEHVPDAKRLLGEVHRLLRPGGTCYFAAGNRLAYMEPHYKLPLLSVIPKPISHLYLRLLGRGSYYYENHRTLWGLRRLVSSFDVIDYTVDIVKEPDRFQAIDMLQPGSTKQKLSLLFLKLAYWLCPTYVWLLRKQATSE